MLDDEVEKNGHFLGENAKNRVEERRRDKA